MTSFKAYWLAFNTTKKCHHQVAEASRPKNECCYSKEGVGQNPNARQPESAEPTYIFCKLFKDAL